MTLGGDMIPGEREGGDYDTRGEIENSLSTNQ